VKRIIVRSELVEEDLLEYLDYISENNPDAALRFIQSVEKAFDLLSEMPDLGTTCKSSNTRLNSIRMWPVPKFSKYLIFYQVTEDSICVLRVLHGSRDIPVILEN